MSCLALQWCLGFEHLGYGSFGRNLQKGLEALHVDLSVNAGRWNGRPGTDPSAPQKDAQTCLLAGMPGYQRGKWGGQFSVLYTMWEADKLPYPFAAPLYNYDLVLVPNESNLDLFSEQPIQAVKKVPLGYDSTVWGPINRPPLEAEFRFMWAGAGALEGTRKGSDLAIAAFRKAFPSWQTMCPTPKLVMKSLVSGPQRIYDFMEVHVGIWSLQELVDLYATCHAAVVPSRGEGWGYHPQQAVATGIPAIVSEIPAYMEYAWTPGFATARVTKKKALPFTDGDGGDWWEPNLDDLVDHMVDFYVNYDKWKAEAEEGAVYQKELYDHVAMARNTLDAIGYEKLVYADTGDWVPFGELEYRTVANRDIPLGDFSINGKPFTFRKDEVYWMTGNQKALLANAGFCANPEDNVGRVPENFIPHAQQATPGRT